MSTDYWDFPDLLAGGRQPLVWSDASLIFASHHSQPLVTARHSSSSKSFTLPSPEAIVNTSHFYFPPKIISCAPQSRWLFAYFPGNNHDGLCCLWHRDLALDSWTVHQAWEAPGGQGIVASDWIPSRTHREWVMDASAKPIRIPHRFPPSLLEPALLLVTQRHELRVLYMRNYTSQFVSNICRLTHQGVSFEGRGQMPDPLGQENALSRICTHAAFGFGFGNTILVATRSVRLPVGLPQSEAPFAETSAESTESLDPSQLKEPLRFDEWGEESVIELAEVTCRFDLQQTGVTVKPLEPLELTSPGVIGLALLPGSPDKMQHLLVTTCVNLIESPPTSHVQVHSISRRPSDAVSNVAERNYTLESARTFEDTILPCVHPLWGSQQVLICRVDATASRRTRSQKSLEAKIGSVHILNLPGLEDNSQYTTSSIQVPLSTLSASGLPLYFSPSPNRVSLCTLSGSMALTRTMTLQALPRQNSSDLSSLVPSLLSALINQRSVDDLVHLIAAPKISDSDCVDFLASSLSMIQSKTGATNDRLLWDLLGVALQVFKTRERQASDTERRTNASRWHNLQEVCSLVACNAVFQECIDGARPEAAEVESIWTLVELSGWLIEYLEDFAKECMFEQDVEGPSPANPDSVPLKLAYACHRAVLRVVISLIHQVTELRSILGTHATNNESTHVARVSLNDMVDRSGLDLTQFVTVLKELDDLGEELPRTGAEAQRQLLTGQGSKEAIEYARKAMRKIQSSGVTDKARLLIKTSDLVDGLQADGHVQPKGRERDIVSKSVLTAGTPQRVCIRCGGKSQVKSRKGSKETEGPHPPGIQPPAPRWTLYENRASWKCVCGGQWCIS